MALSALQQLAASIAKKYNVPPALFIQQISAEDGSWNPNAINGDAIGLGQAMPATVRQYGIIPGNAQSELTGAAAYDAAMYAGTAGGSGLTGAQIAGSWLKTLQGYGTLPQSGTLTPTQQSLADAANAADAANGVNDAGASESLGANAYALLKDTLLFGPLGGVVYDASKATGGTGTPQNPVTGFIATHVGNYALVAVGAVLLIGALLISQRKNINKVIDVTSNVASKAAPLLAA